MNKKFLWTLVLLTIILSPLLQGPIKAEWTLEVEWPPAFPTRRVSVVLNVSGWRECCMCLSGVTLVGPCILVCCFPGFFGPVDAGDFYKRLRMTNDTAHDDGRVVKTLVLPDLPATEIQTLLLHVAGEFGYGDYHKIDESTNSVPGYGFQFTNRALNASTKPQEFMCRDVRVRLNVEDASKVLLSGNISPIHNAGPVGIPSPADQEAARRIQLLKAQLEAQTAANQKVGSGSEDSVSEAFQKAVAKEAGKEVGKNLGRGFFDLL